MAKIRYNRKVNIAKVIAKLVGTIIALYVGNEMINQVGSVLNQTQGPFNVGFKIIGWTVGTFPQCGAGGNYSTTCEPLAEAACNALGQTTAMGSNCITSVSGAGILAVIGLIGIAAIVMEFVEFKL